MQTVRTTWDEVKRRKKFSPGASILFSIESERHRLTWKGFFRLKASPVTKAKFSLSIAGKMKNIVVWWKTSSHVSWLQVWKQMHSWLSLPISTCWRWKETQRGVERRKYSKICCNSERKKTSKVVYVKTQIQWILFYGKLKNWDWTLRQDTSKNSQDALGTKLNSGKEKGNLELSKKVNLMSEILARQVLRRNTWGHLTTSKLYPQSSVEFDEKIYKLKADDNYVLFSCGGARDTEDRMFGMDSGASMHNAEQGELSSDTMDTLRRSKTP